MPTLRRLGALVVLGACLAAVPVSGQVRDARVALASPLPGFEGNGAFDFALTKDGQYAYVAFDGSANVAKVRLADLAIVGSVSIPGVFPVECENMALDVSEKKLFWYSSALRKLVVIDTDTLTVVHTFEDYGLIGMLRSRFGNRLLTWDGGWQVRIVDTETLTVTFKTLDGVWVMALEERPENQDQWYLVARTGPGVDTLTAGVFDHVAKVWLSSVTFPTQTSGEPVFGMAVAASDKIYVGTFGGWYPTGSGSYGWVYSLDLTRLRAAPIAIDGGALCLAVRTDLHRLYVGTGWPISDDQNLLVFDTQTDAAVGQIPLGLSAYGWPHTQMNVLRLDATDPTVLYATAVDTNSFMKIRLGSATLEREVIFHSADVPHASVAWRPGLESAYVVLRNRSAALDLDAVGARITRAVSLPAIPPWSHGMAVSRTGRVYLNQSHQLIVANEPDLTGAVAQTIGGVDGRGLTSLQLSADERFLYSTARDLTQSASSATIFVAIDTSSVAITA